MRITVDLSLYPLQADFVGPITDFIHDLRRDPDLEVITNQMSTQVRGEFAAVTTAVHRCLEHVMTTHHPVVLVAKYLNADLPIGQLPRL